MQPINSSRFSILKRWYEKYLRILLRVASFVEAAISAGIASYELRVELWSYALPKSFWELNFETASYNFFAS